MISRIFLHQFFFAIIIILSLLLNLSHVVVVGAVSVSCANSPYSTSPNTDGITITGTINCALVIENIEFVTSGVTTAITISNVDGGSGSTGSITIRNVRVASTSTTMQTFIAMTGTMANLTEFRLDGFSRSGWEVLELGAQGLIVVSGSVVQSTVASFIVTNIYMRGIFNLPVGSNSLTNPRTLQTVYVVGVFAPGNFEMSNIDFYVDGDVNGYAGMLTGFDVEGAVAGGDYLFRNITFGVSGSCKLCFVIGPRYGFAISGGVVVEDVFMHFVAFRDLVTLRLFCFPHGGATAAIPEGLWIRNAHLVVDARPDFSSGNTQPPAIMCITIPAQMLSGSTVTIDNVSLSGNMDFSGAPALGLMEVAVVHMELATASTATQTVNLGNISISNVRLGGAEMIHQRSIVSDLTSSSNDIFLPPQRTYADGSSSAIGVIASAKGFVRLQAISIQPRMLGNFPVFISNVSVVGEFRQTETTAVAQDSMRLIGIWLDAALTPAAPEVNYCPRSVVIENVSMNVSVVMAYSRGGGFWAVLAEHISSSWTQDPPPAQYVDVVSFKNIFLQVWNMTRTVVRSDTTEVINPIISAVTLNNAVFIGGWRGGLFVENVAVKIHNLYHSASATLLVLPDIQCIALGSAQGIQNLGALHIRNVFYAVTMKSAPLGDGRYATAVPASGDAFARFTPISFTCGGKVKSIASFAISNVKVFSLDLSSMALSPISVGALFSLLGNSCEIQDSVIVDTTNNNNNLNNDPDALITPIDSSSAQYDIKLGAFCSASAKVALVMLETKSSIGRNFTLKKSAPSSSSKISFNVDASSPIQVINENQCPSLKSHYYFAPVLIQRGASSGFTGTLSSYQKIQIQDIETNISTTFTRTRYPGYYNTILQTGVLSFLTDPIPSSDENNTMSAATVILQDNAINLFNGATSDVYATANILDFRSVSGIDPSTSSSSHNVITISMIRNSINVIQDDRQTLPMKKNSVAPRENFNVASSHIYLGAFYLSPALQSVFQISIVDGFVACTRMCSVVFLGKNAKFPLTSSNTDPRFASTSSISVVTYPQNDNNGLIWKNLHLSPVTALTESNAQGSVLIFDTLIAATSPTNSIDASTASSSKNASFHFNVAVPEQDKIRDPNVAVVPSLIFSPVHLEPSSLFFNGRESVAVTTTWESFNSTFTTASPKAASLVDWDLAAIGKRVEGGSTSNPGGVASNSERRLFEKNVMEPFISLYDTTSSSGGERNQLFITRTKTYVKIPTKSNSSSETESETLTRGTNTSSRTVPPTHTRKLTRTNTTSKSITADATASFESATATITPSRPTHQATESKSVPPTDTATIPLPPPFSYGSIITPTMNNVATTLQVLGGVTYAAVGRKTAMITSLADCGGGEDFDENSEDAQLEFAFDTNPFQIAFGESRFFPMARGAIVSAPLFLLVWTVFVALLALIRSRGGFLVMLGCIKSSGDDDENNDDDDDEDDNDDEKKKKKKSKKAKNKNSNDDKNNKKNEKKKKKKMKNGNKISIWKAFRLYRLPASSTPAAYALLPASTSAVASIVTIFRYPFLNKLPGYSAEGDIALVCFGLLTAVVLPFIFLGWVSWRVERDEVLKPEIATFDEIVEEIREESPKQSSFLVNARAILAYWCDARQEFKSSRFLRRFAVVFEDFRSAGGRWKRLSSKERSKLGFHDRWCMHFVLFEFVMLTVISGSTGVAAMCGTHLPCCQLSMAFLTGSVLLEGAYIFLLCPFLVRLDQIMTNLITLTNVLLTCIIAYTFFFRQHNSRDDDGNPIPDSAAMQALITGLTTAGFYLGLIGGLLGVLGELLPVLVDLVLSVCGCGAIFDENSDVSDEENDEDDDEGGGRLLQVPEIVEGDNNNNDKSFKKEEKQPKPKEPAKMSEVAKERLKSRIMKNFSSEEHKMFLQEETEMGDLVELQSLTPNSTAVKKKKKNREKKKNVTSVINDDDEEMMKALNDPLLFGTPTTTTPKKTNSTSSFKSKKTTVVPTDLKREHLAFLEEDFV